MPDEIRMVDITELEPMELIQGVEDPYVEPFLWKVELYLMSKYAPEFTDATVFKIRAAAIERAKIVKEHHFVFSDMEELQREIQSDIRDVVSGAPRRIRSEARSTDFSQRTF